MEIALALGFPAVVLTEHVNGCIECYAPTKDSREAKDLFNKIKEAADRKKRQVILIASHANYLKWGEYP